MPLPPAQQGFGIVEIMISLGLGVVIMLGVTQVATNNSGTRSEIERSARQIENATFALREIEADLTNAGYWGEMGAQSEGSAPPLCPTTACERFDNPTEWNSAVTEDDYVATNCDLNRALRYPVQGGTATLATPDFPCETVVATSPVDTITPRLGTDYVAIRRVNSCAAGSTGCEAPDSNFHLQVLACFAEGIADPDLPGVTYVIAPRAAVLDTDVFQYTQRAANCSSAPAAPQYRFLNRIYYISEDAQLMRADLVWNAAANAHQYQQTALVEGVELMRLEYGLDLAPPDRDGQVDAYSSAPTAAELPDVVMVRVSLVVRSAEPSPGFTDAATEVRGAKTYTIAGQTYCAEDADDDPDDPFDGPCNLVDMPAGFEDHRRQLYTRTVSLRNVAGRREGE